MREHEIATEMMRARGVRDFVAADREILAVVREHFPRCGGARDAGLFYNLVNLFAPPADLVAAGSRDDRSALSRLDAGLRAVLAALSPVGGEAALTPPARAHVAGALASVAADPAFPLRNRHGGVISLPDLMQALQTGLLGLEDGYFSPRPGEVSPLRDRGIPTAPVVARNALSRERAVRVILVDNARRWAWAAMYPRPALPLDDGTPFPWRARFAPGSKGSTGIGRFVSDLMAATIGGDVDHALRQHREAVMRGRGALGSS